MAERYIYCNGQRFVNPRYKWTESDFYNHDFAREHNIPLKELLDAQTPTERGAAAIKFCEACEKVPMSILFKGKDNAKYDKIVENIMYRKYYEQSSLEEEEVTCGFCNELVRDANHFQEHEYIFIRGCIYCDCELHMGDFLEYQIHIRECHPEKTKNLSD